VGGSGNQHGVAVGGCGAGGWVREGRGV